MSSTKIKKIVSLAKDILVSGFTGMNEDKMLKSLVAWSVILHIVVLIAGQFDWGVTRVFTSDEWVIETDLVGMEGALQDTLPQAKEAETLAVSDKLLPQLPKNFTVPQQDQSASEDAMTEDTADKSDEEAAKKSEDQKAKDLELAAKEDQSNKIAMQDALKRLAIEKLRREQKLDKENKASKSDAIARLKAASIGKQDGIVGAGFRQYESSVKKHVGRFWSLPEAYNLRNANLKVSISVTLNERGSSINIKIAESSGDNVFDEFAFNTVREALPLPNPPKNLVGEEFKLNFSPKSY